MNKDNLFTLGDLFNKLEPGESIIVEFPNGYNMYLCRSSCLSKSDAELPIIENCKYDWVSGTYHVKVSNHEISLSPSKILNIASTRCALNSHYGINPLKYEMGWCGNMCNDEFPLNGLRIKKVVHNGPATIIFWNDGTKTVVKCDSEDEFDKEKGILYAALKKLSTKKTYDNILRAIDSIKDPFVEGVAFKGACDNRFRK